MNITSAQYINKFQSNEKDFIEAIINGQKMSVSLDPDNRHYIAIQEWVADGNKIKDAD